MKIIANILQGDKDVTMADISPKDLAGFKYAPVTSVDVERSFSSYKHILSDRRQGFNFENLGKILIIYSNSENKTLP